ncbi:MAG TPA: hypothetical protein DEP84_22875 [Chloroflexi bacterium]|nr:hypothetical protein [Chloroflexota bacterium]
MKKRRVVLLGILLVTLMAAASAVSATRRQNAPRATVDLHTEPAAGAIIPDETLVQTHLRVLDANGQPVPGAQIALHLDTPPRPKILTTDFPYVEGTTLLEFAVDTSNGEMQFETIYPIRGIYTFETHVTLPDGTALDAAPKLSVAENPAEARNFLLFAAILLGFGLLSGLVIGRGYRAALPLALVTALWFVSSVTYAHGPDEHDAPGRTRPITVTNTEGSLHAVLTVAPGSGRVGTLNTIKVRLINPNGTPTDGEVTLQIWQLEDEIPMYTFHLPVLRGEAGLQVQFFDGAKHDIRVEARSADGRTTTVHTPIAVESFSPPLELKMRVAGLLVSVVALGLFVGLWLGTRSRPFFGSRVLPEHRLTW